MVGSPDYISLMPDTVLHHIMGLLNTKQAVQMSVLSRRWEHLWVSLPYLNLDFKDFWPSSKKLEDEDWIVKKLDASRKFVRFVNSLLLRREPLNLDVFRLSCSEICAAHVGHERDWVHYAVQHKVRILQLSFFGSLPDCLFSSKSLVELDISKCTVKICRKIDLPLLEKLVISETDLVKDVLNNLLSGSLLLDQLWLNKLTFQESKISHDKLRHLLFSICQNMNNEMPLLISAPSLVSLWDDLWSPQAKVYMPSIIFVRKVIFMESPVPSWDEIADFLGGLVKVQILEIQLMGWLQLQEGAVLPDLPDLNQLEEFTVGAAPCICCGGQLLLWIITHSPNLKKITFFEENNCKLEESTAQVDGGLLRAAMSQCKTLELVEVKFHTVNNKMMKQFMDAMRDATVELGLQFLCSAGHMP